MPRGKPLRLGRGLDTLIPTEIDELLHSDTPKELTVKGSIVEEVPIDSLVANPHQPRTQFDRGALADLAMSIKKHGILQPLIVTKKEKGYQLIAGERRLRSAKLIKLKTVPVIVRSMEAQAQLEVALIENIQRAELTVLEQAAAYEKLRDQFGLDDIQIGQRVGKAPTTISNFIRLLNLPKEVKTALNRNLISEGHARALLALNNDHPQQQHMLSMIIKRDLTVRQAEEMVRDYRSNKTIDEKKIVEGSKHEQTITKRLTRLLKTPVKIQKTAKGGKLIIEFRGERQLDTIAERILK